MPGRRLSVMPISQLGGYVGGALLAFAGLERILVGQVTGPSVSQDTAAGAGLIGGGIAIALVSNLVKPVQDLIAGYWADRKDARQKEFDANNFQDQIDDIREGAAREIAATKQKAEEVAQRAERAERRLADLEHLPAVVQRNTRRIAGTETTAAVAEGRGRSIARKLAAAGEFAPESGDNLPVIRPRVLIIDDDPATIEMMSEIIDILGCDPTGASSHAEAIQKFEPMPDWVLLDLGLQDDEDGMTIFHDIRQRCERCRIVVITGSEERTQEVLDAGAERVFIKGKYRTRDLEALLQGARP